MLPSQWLDQAGTVVCCSAHNSLVLQAGSLSSGEMERGSTHCLPFAAGLFFSFSTPLLLYIPMPALLTISEVCAESSECKVQGKQWEGQVRTEKGERKRSVTQAQSDGSRLSCSAVCPQRAISTRQQFTHLGTTTPSTAHAFPPPSWGLRQGRGEGGRDTAPGCQHHFQDKRGRKKTLSSPFQQPPSLWTLSMKEPAACKAGGESREKSGILSFGVQGRSALGKCTDTLVLET